MLEGSRAGLSSWLARAARARPRRSARRRARRARSPRRAARAPRPPDPTTRAAPRSARRTKRAPVMHGATPPRCTSAAMNVFQPERRSASTRRPAGGDAVVALAPLPGLLDPAPLDQPAGFHPVEQRIERGGVKGQDAVRPLLDQLGDLVAVARALLEQRQDQHLGAALLQRRVSRVVRPICMNHTYHETGLGRRWLGLVGRPEGPRYSR